MPSDIPIFELPIVLLPGELLPLHIFEDRYKRMVGDCLESEEPFGIVFGDADGARTVGCEARVAEVVETFDDGRMNIIVTGERPFRVIDRREAPEYPVGEIEPIEVTAEEPPQDPETAAAARDAFADLVERVSGEGPDRDELDADDAYAIAARVELPAATKQRLLELRSESDRMKMLADALGALVSTLSRSREIAERATMNGKVVVA